ncbi:Zinc finger MYM-type protein 1 [Merluccius polli]|uniref:Zinc finger MYM-type protein 1 n=1 Tax=Merluccius polli TaxID=89951 RepID=A0AA47MB50_MERPO|nr:Zinc finger MYM-type protein 1 [Merluccius polli]
MCRHFGERGREEKFSQTGHWDWKHINHACSKHQNSKSHTFALEKFNNYRLSMSERGSVIHQLNNTDGRQGEIIERNREHLKVILDVLITCAKQEVPLRGNRENDAGNFLEFYRLVCRHDKATQERLDAIPSNAKMLSRDIENYLFDAACTLLLRWIKRELHVGSFYAILADECKDVSKKQLVAVCLRYVHMGTVRERAVGLVATDNMTAVAIAKNILKVVATFGLDPSLCVGFGFDGASVMSGHKGGVQAILKGTFENAVLNLILSAVARTSLDASTFFDSLFMCGSDCHARFLNMQKEMRPDHRSLELERGCDTRWDSRSAAVTKVFILYDVIVEVLAQYTEGGGQSQIEAQSLLQQIRTYKFIFLLVLFKHLFSKSDFTSKSLKSISTSVADTVDLIENLKQELTDIRSGVRS